MGYYAKATKDYATAIGSQAKAGGIQSAALGANANASADYSSALGGSANASANYSSAVGSYANASSDYAFAGGYYANASNESTIALGNNANASGESAIAQGYHASASQENSIAIGTEANASGMQSIAIGSSNNVSGVNSSAIGNNNTISSAAQNTSVLGNNVSATTKDSVILGDSSQGDASVVGCSTAKVNNITYGGFAGNTVDSGEYVSIGAKGDERKIINVAAGNITADSTEAINGSQLYIVANNLTDYVNNVSWKLGNNSGTKVDDVKAGDQVNFVNGTNTVSSVIANDEGTVSNVSYSVKVDNSTIKTGDDGNVTANTTNLTVNNNGTVKVDDNGNGSNLVNASTVINAINNASFVATIGTNTTTFANQEGKSNYTVKAGETLVFQAGKNLKVKQENGTFTYATEDNVSFENVKVGNVTINSTTGIDAGNTTITNVANGTNATDAVNLSQLNSTKTEVKSANQTVTVTNSTGTEGQTIYNVEVNADGKTINTNSSTGALEVVSGNTTTNSNGTAKVADGSNNTDVATIGDIVNTMNNVSWNITSGTNGTGTQAGTKSDEQVKAGETVTLLAGDNMVIKQDGQNFTYSVSENPTFSNVTVNNTLTVGPVKINNTTGIDAGNTTITNVSNGTNATDAVNLSQLNATKTEVTSNNKTVNVTNSTGANGQTIYNVEVNTDNTTIKPNSTTGALEVVTGNTTTNTNGTAAVANGSNASSVATVGDIVNTINNVSWKLGNSTAQKVDDVKAGDQVNFVNGTNTVSNVTVNDDGTVSNVSYSVNVDNSTIKTSDDGKVTANTTNLTVNDNGTVKVDDANGSNLVNASTVTNAINNASFVATIGKDATDFTDQQGKSSYKVKAGETLTFQAGKNLKVKQDNGTFTYATEDNVTFNNVNTTTLTVGNGANSSAPTVNFSAEAATNATNNNASNMPVNALNITTNGKPTQITGVGSVLNTQTVNTNPNGTASSSTLVNLTNLPETTLNSAATVRDLQNMGWVVSAQGNNYTDTVKNANEVKFVGEGAVNVTGVTNNNIRYVNISVNETQVRNNITGNATVDSNGKAVVPNITNNATAGDQLVNATTLVNVANNVSWKLGDNNSTKVDDVKAGDQINFVNGSNTVANVTVTENGTVSNVSYSVNVDNSTIKTDGDKIVANTTNLAVNDNGTVKVDGGDGANLVNATTVTNAINNASFVATIGSDTSDFEDQKGKADYKVKAGETLKFQAGKNLKVKQENGTFTYATADDVNFNSVKVGNVTINSTTGIDAGNTTITNVTAGTNATDAVNVSQLNSSIAASKEEVTSNDKSIKVNVTQNANGSNVFDLAVNTDGKTINTNSSTGALEVVSGNTTTNDNGTAEVKNGSNTTDVATIGDIVNTINNVSWNTVAGKVDGTNGEVEGNATAKVKAGETVTYNAGKNIKIVQNGTTFNLSTTDDVNFNSVKVGNVTINSSGIDAGNTQITNVTAGTNGTDAVNLDQLNKSVAASKEEVTSKDKSVTVNVSQNATTGANIYDLAVNTDGTTINTNSTTGKLEVITGGSQVNANGTAAAKSGDENKVATVGDIVNTVNNVSWNLTTSKSDGNVTGTTEEQIKAGEVVTIDAGKNINVTQSANKISIATNMNSSFDSVVVGPVTINSTGIDAGNTTITNVANGTNGTDAVNLNQLNKSVAAAKTEVTSKDNTVNVTNSTGANGQTIYDLSVKTGSFGNTTNGSLVAGNDGFATVTDIINAVNSGYWKVGNNAGTETAQIKFGDQVNFVNGVGTKSNVSGSNVTFDVNLVSGDNSVSVTNNTDGSVNLSVNTTNVKNALAGNVTTNPNGTVKVADNTDGSNFVNATNVVDAINKSGWITNSTTATGGATETVINPGKAVNFEAGDNMQVTQSVDANGNVTYTYATKENVTFKNLTVTGDTQVHNFSVAPNSTVDMGGNQITNVSAGTNGTDAVNVDQLKENITNINNNIANATESVKWKLTGNNDDANATTVGNQTVSFNNGTGTVAVVNGTNVTYNVDTGNITTNTTTGVASGDITPTKIATTGDVINAINNSGWRTTNSDGSTSLINPGDSVNYVNGKGTSANVTTKDGVTSVSYDVKTTDLTVNDNGTVAAPTDGSSVVNATTVANTVNNVSWNLHSTKVEGSSGKVTESSDTKAAKVKAGNTVNINAGNNIEITRKGNDVAIATSMNPTFDSVKIGSGNNATTISSNESGISIAGNNGEARQIHNVKGGSADTDAVNVSQLKQSMGDVYNRLNRNNKDLRAGIAGANAAAGLPQVYIPGKSMVAASAGTFKGQSAVAVGYSRASDNGKVILKLQGNANTQGDVGGSVGVGYQW
ncbi:MULTISPECIES: YadA-like family protein [Pasteurellaceae]|uniref:YadA-like family protein n=1 Tax=Pasteurellaceae TaxID=712 RepID=UPI003565FDC0